MRALDRICGSVWRDLKLRRCNTDDDVDLVVVVVVVIIIVVVVVNVNVIAEIM